MSDLSATSYCKDNNNECGLSPIFLILILLMVSGGDSGGFLGGLLGGDSCSSGNGLGGILPLLLVLLMCGGSF